MRSLTPIGALRVPLCRRALSTKPPRSRRPFESKKLRRSAETQSQTKSPGRPNTYDERGTKSTKFVARINALGSSQAGHDAKTRLRQDFSKTYNGRHNLFRDAVLSRFQIVLSEMSEVEKKAAGVGEDELNRQAIAFMNTVDNAFLLAEQGIVAREKNPFFWNLREALIQRDLKGLGIEIRYAFQSFLVRNQFSKSLQESQQKLLDFRYPLEWFPATREMQRTVHIHVGPTNSGKTYRALQALQNAKSGVYAGPLRLLAAEVWQRMQTKGIPCALLTGEEIRIPEDTDDYFTSCTVEMIPLNKKMDVAVIDEIQMLGDDHRGSAWTIALLGVQAKEVHVCGEERAVKLVQSLCAGIGDKCIVHRYDRLSPLRTMETALGNDYTKLEKGDAVVSFNRRSLYALKQRIENETGKRCAIVYGSLPPEVRIQQAALFNDPNNDYDYIVASDAIGMGLNLEIRRVILEAVSKFDGSQNRMLTRPEIKQIGGRAGRYRSATNPDGPENELESNVGYVTTMDHDDLADVESAFREPVTDIERAYVDAPASIIEKFATYYPPSTPLSFILMRIKAGAMLSSHFSLTTKAVDLEIADLIQDIPLTIPDKLTFIKAPSRLQFDGAAEVLRALARIVAENKEGDLLSIKEIPLHALDINIYGNLKGREIRTLQKLEGLHDAITVYTWMSYRFAGVFRNQALAFHVRSMVEQRLNDLLERLDYTRTNLEEFRKRSRREARERDMNLLELGELNAEEEANVEHVPEDTPEAGFVTDASRLEDLVETSRSAVIS